MFEQKAKEYAENTIENWNYRFSDEIEYKIKQTWQDGAEYGYNKANEWHYVKDGDLPKAYQKCYFIYSNTYKDNKVVFSESNVNVLTGLYAFYYDQETGEETTDPCFYDNINDDEIDLKEVYAWKEIVIPELPGERMNKMQENEWHKIERKNDLPWEEGRYTFRDKEGEIEEIYILWDDNDDCNICWEYYDAWKEIGLPKESD